MYKRLLFAIIISLAIIPAAFAQLTFTITDVPANTPPDATLYVAGNFQNWNPGAAAWALTKQPNGDYTITFNPSPGTLEFKFTRGSWATVEGNATGNVIPNRTYTYNGQPTTVEFSVLSWEDLGGGSNPGSTAAANVSILDDDFYIPQLDRTRRIWLYLPPDYASTNKHYPVIYMHDGQNVFDDATSFAGEWHVDETLNDLHAAGDYGAIVIAIDNGGVERLNEYSPWVNPQYGGGDGDAYVDFIVETLKPYVDSNYRTLPGRDYTATIGSSMGALISMYALIEHQDVFSKAGIFSSAFWFAGNAPANHVTATGKQDDVRVYFLAGGEEPDYVEDDMNDVSAAMTTAGFGPTEKTSVVVPGGTHSEGFWAQEFGDAYEWLFMGLTIATDEAGRPADADISIFPNPASRSIRLTGLSAGEFAAVRILGHDGRLWQDTLTRAGEAVSIANLPPGFYVVKARDRSGHWHTAKLTKVE
jgi:predicted alpha/beta superfamily hydrolase